MRILCNDLGYYPTDRGQSQEILDENYSGPAANNFAGNSKPFH